MKRKTKKDKNCDLNSGKYNNNNYWRKYLPASIIAKLPAQTDAKDDEPVKKGKKKLLNTKLLRWFLSRARNKKENYIL